MKKIIAIPALGLVGALSVASAAAAWHPETGSATCTNKEGDTTVVTISNPTEWWSEGHDMIIVSDVQFDSTRLAPGETTWAILDVEPGHHSVMGYVSWDNQATEEVEQIDNQKFLIEVEVPECIPPAPMPEPEPEVPVTPAPEPPAEETPVIETEIIPPVAEERLPVVETEVAPPQVLAHTGVDTPMLVIFTLSGIALVSLGTAMVLAPRSKKLVPKEVKVKKDQ